MIRLSSLSPSAVNSITEGDESTFNMRKLYTFFFNRFYRRFPPEMVSWWKRKDMVRAKVTKDEDGHYIMWMEGEKYPFPGFPRGHLLFGSLSPLKHNIKVKIFNHAWERLESGDEPQEIIDEIKGPIFDEILELGENSKYDFLPPEKMVPSVREIHRAWTVAEQYIRPDKRPKMAKIKDILCFILQEDDGYRFRVQWLVNYFPKRNIRKNFDRALKMMEHAEVVGDMKERIRLLRRILNLVLDDEIVGKLFEIFVKEVDWKEVKLTKADKFFFRAKYFKVDYPIFDY